MYADNFQSHLPRLVRKANLRGNFIYMSEFIFNPGKGSTADKVTFALERISEAFRVLLWEENRRNGLSPVQNQLLIFLLHHSGPLCSVSSLAAEFNMTKPTISDAVKVLEQKELVRRTADAHDARVFHFSLTARGRQTARKAELFATPVATAIAALPESEQEKMLFHLLQIIRSLYENGIIQQQRMCLNCAHYQPLKAGQFKCTLLNQTLAAANLRVDCPEHELLTTE
jgi:DNA-binding MarR family transcriptional regulator